MINSRSLQELLPQVRSRMISFIAIAEVELSEKLLCEVKIKPTRTYTDAESQDAIYAQGRTAPGKIVTNARGGESLHQYRCAADFALSINGTLTWDKSYYQMLGEIGKRQGLTWGGDWNGDGKADPTDWDYCHFQWTGGLTLAELKSGSLPA